MLFKDFVINIACPCAGKYPVALRALLGRADSPLSFYADLAQISYSYKALAQMLNLLDLGYI